MKKSTLLDVLAIALLLIIGAICLAIYNTVLFLYEGNYFSWFLKTIIAPILVLTAAYYISLYLYLHSNKFKKIKSAIQNYIDNCNNLNRHIENLKLIHQEIYSEDTGIGELTDNSNYNFKRQHWEYFRYNKFTYNCSSTVCKNAQNQPIKYLCKYFAIEKNEESLKKFEQVLNDYSAVEEGKHLLNQEISKIYTSIERDIPFIFNLISKKVIINRLGFEEVDLSEHYFSSYAFQYISPGGNSSVRFDLTLNIGNLEILTRHIADHIKFRESIKGQRALMTTSLREEIKHRDNYTCRLCGLSPKDEENLLLEIDHIRPLSKGGITERSNLQTLCWKCNRKKGNKYNQNPPTEIETNT